MTRVKICGLTRPDDAALAVEHGAWALGMVFHAVSPRHCPLAAAEEIGAAFRRSAELAGVFVNAPLDRVALTADRCHLSLLQLHGDEGPAYCREAARRTGCRIIKAARVRDASSIRFLRTFRTDFHLLDAYVAGRPGGTGETFNWELARAHRRSVPVILSGGLTPDNVGDGIRAVDPFAVDTASGTEASPGRKDPARLTAFFRAVEAATLERAGRDGERTRAPAGVSR
jgi:phosphoribosylanthranilate isomerase